MCLNQFKFYWQGYDRGQNKLYRLGVLSTTIYDT